MKKNIRTLLIMLAVLVVLGGGAAALLLTQPQTTVDESSVSSSSAEAVIDRETNEVASVAVENPNASFVMVPVDGETASLEEESSSAEFTVDGYQGFDLDTSKVTAAVNLSVSINASKNLGEQEDLAQFGLSGVGAASVKVTYTDGSTDEFVIGNEAGETAGRYFLKDGVVYISASYSSNILQTPFTFFNKDVYTVADRVEETVDSEGSSSTTTLTDILYHMELSGENVPQDVVIDYDSSKVSTYLITEPITAESGSTTFTEIVTALKTLTAEAVAATGRTQETLEEFGLAQPYAQITFDMNGEEHTLAVSAKNSSGNRYLIADDIDVVYEVAGDSVDVWAEASLLDLRMSYVWLPTIYNVKTMTVKVADGTAYTFQVDRQVNEEKSTETNTSYDMTVENGDGAVVDYENYQDFYQLALSQAVLSVEEIPYSAEDLVAEITYEYFDGSDPDVVTYCASEDQDQRYVALLNGGYNGVVRRSEIENLLAKLTMTYANQAIE